MKPRCEYCKYFIEPDMEGTPASYRAECFFHGTITWNSSYCRDFKQEDVDREKVVILGED